MTFAHFQSFHPFPIWNWHPSSCSPGGGSQSGRFGFVLGLLGPLNGLSQGTSSFFCCLNPHWFLQSEIRRLYFPGTGTLGYTVAQGWDCWLPSYPSQFYPPHVIVGPPVLPATLLLPPHYRTTSSPPYLPISTPPSCQDKYGFSKSLVAGLPYGLIFWQFWVIFLRLVLILLMVVQGGEACLLMSPS